jgi:hypothetical protein
VNTVSIINSWKFHKLLISTDAHTLYKKAIQMLYDERFIFPLNWPLLKRSKSLINLIIIDSAARKQHTRVVRCNSNSKTSFTSCYCALPYKKVLWTRLVFVSATVAEVKFKLVTVCTSDAPPLLCKRELFHCNVPPPPLKTFHMSSEMCNSSSNYRSLHCSKLWCYALVSLTFDSDCINTANMISSV